MVLGEKADPLMLLLLYVGGDKSGLFRSDTLWRICKSLEIKVLGRENFSIGIGYVAYIGAGLFFAWDCLFEPTMASKEGVGYAGHIGGMLGGALLFALDCLLEPAMASKLSDGYFTVRKWILPKALTSRNSSANLVRQ
jgi:membrane associated rhomboid family serine protease